VNRVKIVPRCAVVLLVLGLALGIWGAAYAADEGWLGVMLQPLSGELSEAMNIGKDVEGVLVADVVVGSPAEAAGLEKGDVLVEIDGATVASTEEAIALVKGHAPGDKVKIVAVRDGKRNVVTAVLGTREAVEQETEAIKDYYDIKIPRVERIFEKFTGGPGGYLGVTVHDMSSDLSPYFGVREGEGVLVLEVLEDTPAERAGLRAGDVIIKVKGEAITDAGELLDEMRGIEPGEKADVTFKRNRETRRVEVEVEESPDAARVFIRKMMRPDEGAPPCKESERREIEIQCEMMKPGEPGEMRTEIHREMMAPGEPGAQRQELKSEMEQLRKEIEHLKQEIETLKK
jgi:C-terminal processing protease CtpA/Prc